MIFHHVRNDSFCKFLGTHDEKCHLWRSSYTALERSILGMKFKKYGNLNHYDKLSNTSHLTITTKILIEYEFFAILAYEQPFAKFNLLSRLNA
jgi:hypothetical protein